ncbi:MAG: Mur ligase family protein [Candidatus Pacebacteria bacterium]|nr:Mur ligase family protein [Candidatus Paceibacterota bacterium]
MKEFLKKSVVSILTSEAKVVLAKYKPKIIVVTGSVGKTSTKDAIFTLLNTSLSIRKSEKSLRSELGVPLAILGVENARSDIILWLKNIIHGVSLILFRQKYPDWLILEIRASRPGNIRNIMAWLKPDIAVVTPLGDIPVHIEFFKTPEALLREKGYLVSSLKEGGLAVLNVDDKNFEYFKSISRQHVITYGFMDNVAEICGAHSSILYEDKDGRKIPTGITFKVDYQGNSFPVSLFGILGVQHIYPALAALAVGVSQNINIVKMTEALSSHVPPPGRMKILSGMKETIIIDDTFNASPVATKEALLTLRELDTKGKKIAILGDMMELGKFSTEEHEKIGALAGEACDILVTVGLRARGIAEGALDEEMDESKIFQFEDSIEAGKFIQNKLSAGDVVLVKGSQIMEMENTVKEIMAYPEDAKKLLVRQGK